MKKQVSFTIMDDMQKYIPDVNPDDYDRKYFGTDESVVVSVRNYYDGHLPVDLSAWIRVNEPDKSLSYGKYLKRQVYFVRDYLYLMMTEDYLERRENPPMVISTHVSKNVKIPVYQFNLKNYGMEIILWSNFYTWIISINSEKPVECDFMELFDPEKVIPHYYCEGVPKNKVFGCYEKNHSQFTLEITFFQEVYVFFFLLKHYLGIGKE